MFSTLFKNISIFWVPFILSSANVLYLDHSKVLSFLALYPIDTNFERIDQHTAFENIVGKEEIACNEQFLLFPQYFLLNQKIVSPFVNIYYIISLFAAELNEPKIGM